MLVQFLDKAIPFNIPSSAYLFVNGFPEKSLF